MAGQPGDKDYERGSGEPQSSHIAKVAPARQPSHSRRSKLLCRIPSWRWSPRPSPRSTWGPRARALHHRPQIKTW